VLTPKGKEQCRALKAAFAHHQTVDAVFASPLRRTIQTASLSFGPTLTRKEVPFILIPGLQELGATGSDTGLANTAADLKQLLPDLFAEGELEFDLAKIDASAVTAGWNSKVPQHQSLRSYLPTPHSEATGHTRRKRSPNAQQMSGTGCFSVPRRRSSSLPTGLSLTS
jgi:hypothetical protein